MKIIDNPLYTSIISFIRQQHINKKIRTRTIEGDTVAHITFDITIEKNDIQQEELKNYIRAQFKQNNFQETSIEEDTGLLEIEAEDAVYFFGVYGEYEKYAKIWSVMVFIKTKEYDYVQ